MNEKLFQKQSRIFKAGVIIIFFCSAVIGFFNIAIFFWFGIPILGLLLGLIFVWLSKEKIKTKILFTLAPIPIILAAFYLFYLLLPKAEPEIFLIPQNFRGRFEIIFNQPCGETIPYENGGRIYKIPDNGVIITSAGQTFGVIDRKFYLIDENENRSELPEFHWSKFEQERNDWHWTFSGIEINKQTVGVDNHPGIVNYLIFTVSDYASLEKETEETKKEKQKSFQDKIKVLLGECRKTL